MDGCLQRIIERLPFEYNDYNFLSFIGQGTYSVVFEVTKSSWKNRRCAAKITYTDDSFDLESGYLHEAELDALMSLHHPNIIRLFDYFLSTNLTLLEATYDYEIKSTQDESQIYELTAQLEKEKAEFTPIHNYVIVMILNYCPYGTLEQYFNDNGSFTLSDFNDEPNLELMRKSSGNRTFMCDSSLNISSTGMNIDTLTFLQNLMLFSNIVSALYVCHTQGIAHRDLKPANIFIDNYKRAIVADFGLSSIQTNSVDTACGSPFYCAPEIFMTGVSYDPFPADIFALGVTAYQVFTGFLPYSEKQLRSAQIDNSKLTIVFPGYENDYEDNNFKDFSSLSSKPTESHIQIPKVHNQNPLASLDGKSKANHHSIDLPTQKASNDDYFGSQERRIMEKKEARLKLATLIIDMLHKNPLERPTIEIVNSITKEVNNVMNPPKRNKIKTTHNQSMHRLMNQQAAMNFLLKANECTHQKKKLTKNFQVSSSLNNLGDKNLLPLITPQQTIFEDQDESVTSSNNSGSNSYLIPFTEINANAKSCEDNCPFRSTKSTNVLNQTEKDNSFPQNEINQSKSETKLHQSTLLNPFYQSDSNSTAFDEPNNTVPTLNQPHSTSNQLNNNSNSVNQPNSKST